MVISIHGISGISKVVRGIGIGVALGVFLFLNIYILARVYAAPTTLSANDVVIVTANSDPTYVAGSCASAVNNNAIDLLLRKDITAGTVIKITDNGWNGSTLASSEGIATYTATADLSAGTIVRYSDCATQTAGSGWVRTVNFDPSSGSPGGDNLFVYQGSEASPNFIYGFGFRSNTWISSGSITSNTSYIPTALSSASPQAYTFMGSTTARNYQYTTAGNYGIYSSTFLAALKVASNWTSTGGSGAGVPYPMTTVPFDATRPMFNAAVRQSPGTNPSNASAVTFRITTTEGVQALASNAFTVSTTGTLIVGSVVTTSVVDNKTFDVTVSGISGSGTISLASFTGTLLDLQGNPATNTTFSSQSFTIDQTRPTVTVDTAPLQADPTANGNIMYTAKFSKSIDPTTITASDFTIGGSLSASVTSIAQVTADTWTITVTGPTSGDIVSLSLPSGRVQDLLGNTNTTSTSIDNTVLYDATQPNAFAVNVDVNSAGYDMEHPRITFATTDLESGVQRYEVSVDSGPFTIQSSGYTPTLAVLVSHTITVRAYDFAGNYREKTVEYPPSVSINAPTVLHNTAITDTIITIGGPVGLKITGVTISGAGSSGFDCGTLPRPVPFSCTGGSITESGLLAVSAISEAGVESTNSQSYVIDTIPPAVTIEKAIGQPDSTNSAPIRFEMTVSEPIKPDSFLQNINVSGGSPIVSLTQTSALTWLVELSHITKDGVVSISMLAGAVQDLAGNASLASVSTDNSVLFDATAPAVSMKPLVSSNNSPELSGLVDDTTATVFVSVNGGLSYPAVNNGDGTWTLPAGTIKPALNPGSYEVNLSYSDQYGNSGVAVSTITITALVAPTITTSGVPNTGLRDQTRTLTILMIVVCAILTVIGRLLQRTARV